MRRAGAAIAALMTLCLWAAACSATPDPIVVGAVYPLTGSQGPGGIDEYRGVRVAVDMVNAGGGVDGRPIDLQTIDVESADAAPGAVDSLVSHGARYVLGSYGSTISAPAAVEADRRRALFWESGAVGQMSPSGQGTLVFRVAPSGSVLGSAAIAFVAERLAPLLRRSPTSLRFAVANVDDIYGTAVARGAVEEIRTLGVPFVGQFPYDAVHLDPASVIRRIAAARPDVLFVSAYLEDGVALRREMVRQHLHLVANIGSSSSYCMPAFGAALGREAVGLFASDKPDGDSLNPAGLTPDARGLLAQAQKLYRARYRQDMSAPALSGFSAAWALFHVVMPSAASLTPGAVGAAALRARIPRGGLPNGSGLRFAPPGSPDAGANLLGQGVIWEWTWVGWRDIVWPAQFATAPIQPIQIET